MVEQTAAHDGKVGLNMGGGDRVDSTFDSKRLRGAQTVWDEKGLEFRPRVTGETGSDGEKRGAAFSKTAGCRFDSCPTCPINPEMKRL